MLYYLLNIEKRSFLNYSIPASLSDWRDSREMIVRAARLFVPILVLPVLIAFLLFPKDERRSRFKAWMSLFIMSLLGTAASLFAPSGLYEVGDLAISVELDSFVLDCYLGDLFTIVIALTPLLRVWSHPRPRYLVNLVAVLACVVFGRFERYGDYGVQFFGNSVYSALVFLVNVVFGFALFKASEDRIRLIQASLMLSSLYMLCLVEEPRFYIAYMVLPSLVYVAVYRAGRAAGKEHEIPLCRQIAQSIRV